MSIVDIDSGRLDHIPALMADTQAKDGNAVAVDVADGAQQKNVIAAAAKRVNLNITFKDIMYTVQQKKEAKPILRGISGAVDSGKMMCVLGPTGSGKTSLIHIIAHKITSKPGKEVLGSVRCNQAELSATKFQRISGLVTQEDVFNAALTVKETLMFTAKLKLSCNHTEQMETVVKQLQLEKCLTTFVGDDSNPYLKGISGGEKRRLAIAMEIIDPDISVLILDEPTSGLDAAAALNVANLLRTLADSGIAVAATLHQPRATIVSLFETLMVLSQGRRVFHGPLGQYVPYLESDLRCELPKHDNPYDFLLDVLNPVIREQINMSVGVLPDGCEDVSNFLSDVYDKSALASEVEATCLSQVDIGVDQVNFAIRGVGWCGKFATILHRTFLVKMRDPMVLMTQVATAVIMGLLFGMLYWQSYDKDPQFMILDTQMAVMMCTLMAVWLPYDVTLTFPRERQIFLRERKAGLYHTSAFYVARISADMPFHIFASALMAAIIYPMVDLQSGPHIFIAVNVAGCLSGAALMQMIGAVSATFEEANILMLLIMMVSMVMSTGFLRSVPSWLVWMREISVMGLIADLAMYFEFHDIDPKFGTPREVFDSYGVRVRSDEDVSLALIILLIIYLVARLLTYLAVKFMHTGRSFSENLSD